MNLEERRRISVGYAIKRAFHAQRVAIDAALRDFGITTAQWATLMTLSFHEGVSNAELARLNECTPQTMNTIILHLEEVGLVERTRHPRHGILLQARLTDAGRDLLARCTERVEALEERMMADLSPDERQQLVNLLGRCVDAIRPEPADAR